MQVQGQSPARRVPSSRVFTSMPSAPLVPLAGRLSLGLIQGPGLTGSCEDSPAYPHTPSSDSRSCELSELAALRPEACLVVSCGQQ